MKLTWNTAHDHQVEVPEQDCEIPHIFCDYERFLEPKTS